MNAPPHLLEAQRWSGLRIGLFGGSFNPPHPGHVHASEIALKYLGLDAIWWLVSPGNPLKKTDQLPSLGVRLAACRRLVRNPRILVSDIEDSLGTLRTYHTIKALKRYFPHTSFAWCGGVDLAHEFHRWYRWRDLPTEIPFAFVGRPVSGGIVRSFPLQGISYFRNVFLHRGGTPLLEHNTIFWIVEERQNPLSSTLLRAQSGYLPFAAHQDRMER